MDDTYTDYGMDLPPPDSPRQHHTQADEPVRGPERPSHTSSFRKAFEEQEAGIKPSLIPHKKPAHPLPPTTIDLNRSQYKTVTTRESATASHSTQKAPRSKTHLGFALATVAIGATLAYLAFRHESETLASSDKEITR